jgi:hypothetical protein
MNENDDVTLTPEQEKRLHIAIHRMRANFLNFWVLCTKAACRKAHECSADPEFCMSHLGPDVPDDLCHAVDELMFGKFSGLPFDEVVAKAPHLLSTYGNWLEKVKQTRAKPDAEKPPDGLATS